MKHLKKYETFKEKDMEYRIYVDLDGVLTDFDKNIQDGFLKEFNKENGTNIKDGFEFEDEYGRNEFWKRVDELGIEFWSEMPWMKDGKKLWNFIKEYDTEILTKPSKQKICKEGKRKWCDRELGDVKVNIEMKKEKYAKPNHILIDDLEKNIVPWIAAGGIGILHKNAEDTIKKLKGIPHK
jgi:FMN phosphatase YigB (HAD superfamily)